MQSRPNGKREGCTEMETEPITQMPVSYTHLNCPLFRIISGNPRQFNYRDESANCAYCLLYTSKAAAYDCANSEGFDAVLTKKSWVDRPENYVKVDVYKRQARMRH